MLFHFFLESLIHDATLILKIKEERKIVNIKRILFMYNKVIFEFYV